MERIKTKLDAAFVLLGPDARMQTSYELPVFWNTFRYQMPTRRWDNSGKFIRKSTCVCVYIFLPFSFFILPRIFQFT